MVAPRINALQKLWLREIGIEKTWLQVAEPVVVPQASTQAESFHDESTQARGANAPAGDDSVGVGGAARTADGPAAALSAVRAADATKGERAVAKGPLNVSVVPAAPVAAPRPPRSSPSIKQPQPAAESRSVTEPVIPATDFDALRDQVQQCTSCGLCQGRRHAVFGMGARPARWMVVGEAPGEQEDRQGLPFVGRSGQLLDAMLSAVGMSREKDVFIANVIKCRPPGNRNPKPEEIAACSPYLKRQIELIQPERILVLGRFAAQTLLGTDATIGNLRGRQHALTTDDGRSIPVIVSYHPAYLLRSPTEKARAWQDLRLAATSG
ncbi:uracil-DNA glycosylase [Bordetella tumulicola]